MTPKELEEYAAKFHHSSVICRATNSSENDGIVLSFFTRPLVFAETLIPDEKMGTLTNDEASSYVKDGLNRLESMMTEFQVFVNKGLRND